MRVGGGSAWGPTLKEATHRLRLAQVAYAGLEVFTSAVGNFRFGSGLLQLKIAHARGAVAAADGFDVKLNVVGFFLRQDSHEVAAELLARGAAQAMTAPDFTE